MKISIIIELDEKLLRKIVDGIMENYPEAGAGMTLICTEWNYNDCEYKFLDTESLREYKLDCPTLARAVTFMFSDSWPKGCTKPPTTCDPQVWESWLGEADACDFDAFVQLACLNEVIYG